MLSRTLEMRRRTLALSLALATTTLSAQPSLRRATNLAALQAHAAFYHLRPIVIVGKVSLQDSGDLMMTDDAGTVRVVFKGSAPEGLDEIRGEFWDIGRMHSGDPRLAGYDLQKTFHVDPEGAWPRPGQVTAVIASAVVAASPPSMPAIHAMVLYPARYLDQKVTVTGQFAGRNLLGDLPDAPAKSRYDFVLRSADAAIWVVNIRPKGKDFELALDARIDTGRWIEVSGTLQQGRGLQWLDAQAGSLKLAKAPVDATTQEAPIRVPAAPPPEVIFSAPTQDETDVQLSANIRIQFSRDVNPATIKDHVRVTYGETQIKARSEPDSPMAEFTTQYLPANRVLEIHFSKPLERFLTVHVELVEGILGTDKQPLIPWKLDFTTGGS
jgi:Big-like domain-containing protein